MKIIDFIIDKLGLAEEGESDFELLFSSQEDESDLEEAFADTLRQPSLSRLDVNILDYRDREMFVRNKCEQMQLAAAEIEQQRDEYARVTEKLTDIDEIMALPERSLNEIKKAAALIIRIEEDEEKYVRPVSKITEAQYREMEKLQDEVPDIIKKIRKQEDYQMTVKRDLNLLEGEKGALAYQRKEEKTRAANSKALAFVIVFVSVLAACLLMVLQATLNYEVMLGYYIILAIMSFSLVGVCVNYKNALNEQTKAEKKLNRAITLQNSVKIKYVNATNLIDYYYSKYNVNNSYELNYMYEKFIEEKNARNHSEDVAIKMEQARKELGNLLKRYRINDLSTFVYQPDILTNEDVMMDVRKGLIIQRQKLKKSIDFNNFNLDSAKKDVEALVAEYPKYGKEILAIVSQYE